MSRFDGLFLFSENTFYLLNKNSYSKFETLQRLNIEIINFQTGFNFLEILSCKFNDKVSHLKLQKKSLII